jgi:hypothetical protein
VPVRSSTKVTFWQAAAKPGDQRGAAD